ncbi:MAG: hypothetical protein PVH84_14615 [Candidatus Aminicenantes bacterium]
MSKGTPFGRISRRQFISRAMPICSVACLGRGNLLAWTSPKLEAAIQEEKHKFEQEYPRKLTIKHFCFPLLLSILVACTCCAPSSKIAQEPPLQETKYFDNFSLDSVWAAVLLAIDDLNFAIQKEIKESGFIYAQSKINPDPRYLPPHLNVYIRNENGRVRVNCHVVIPAQETNFETSSAIVKHFFTALASHLTQ